MKIVFFGTPDFGKIILQKLIEQKDFEIVGVVCAPDKPVGRKKVMTPPPVKILAEENNLKIWQPNKINTEFLDELAEAKADLFVVAAYGKILPQRLLDLPAKGVINVHPSLLPKYRGASPIQSVLLNGEKETGVTIMKMDAEMDHGEIMKSEKLEMKNDIRFKELHDELAKMGAEILVEVLPKYFAGETELIEQDHEQATFCKMIKKEDGEIDWSKSAEEIYNMWRAFEEWPKISTQYSVNKKQGLIKTTLVEIKLISSEEQDWGEKKPGEFFVQDKKLYVMCGDGNVLEILKIQPEGKKVMDASGFANGYLR